MTHRERIDAAFAHIQPDRTPVFEYVLLSPVAEAVLGRKYVDFGGDWQGWIALAREKGYENALRDYATDRLDMAQTLGHDMLYCVPNPPYSAIAPRAEAPAFSPDDDPVETMRRRNEQAARALDAPEDETPYLVYAMLRREMDRRGEDLPLYAPAFCHGVWDDVALMQTMLLDEDVARTHFALQSAICMRITDRLVSLGADMVGVGGDFAGNRPLISPACYRRFILPELRKCVAHAHALGARAVNASDGDLWSVIDDFLTGTGVDAYGEVDEKAGMTLPLLKARFGNSVTFFGNLDCGLVLTYAAPEEIRRQTIQCIEDGWGGGHVLTASNAICASVPPENYFAMVNAYRDFFGLPRLRPIP